MAAKELRLQLRWQRIETRSPKAPRQGGPHLGGMLRIGGGEHHRIEAVVRDQGEGLVVAAADAMAIGHNRQLTGIGIRQGHQLDSGKTHPQRGFGGARRSGHNRSGFNQGYAGSVVGSSERWLDRQHGDALGDQVQASGGAATAATTGSGTALATDPCVLTTFA